MPMRTYVYMYVHIRVSCCLPYAKIAMAKQSKLLVIVEFSLLIKWVFALTASHKLWCLLATGFVNNEKLQQLCTVL